MRATLTKRRRAASEPEAHATDLRAARKLETMRRVQAAALDLFEERGFDAVRIEDVASAASVGPASVYRYFATKERIVLWDEYDPHLFAAVARRLPGSPVEAFLGGLGEALGAIYARDKRRILRRTRLTKQTPALLAAAASERAAFRTAIADLLASAKACDGGLETDVAAGVMAAVLEAAVDHWARKGGRTSLKRLLEEAFTKIPRSSVAGTRTVTRGGKVWHPGRGGGSPQRPQRGA